MQDDLARLASDFPASNLRGLMAIPAATDASEQRATFCGNARHFRAMQSWPLNGHLLMGMSGDLEAAIAEGDHRA